MRRSKLQDLLGCFGSIFVQCCAATEATMIVSVLGKDDHRTDSAAALERLASAGRLTPGVEVFITDKDGNELPADQTREIRIRRRAVARGYCRNPEGTAAEFADDVWRSGDLGLIDTAGYLFIVDRLKDVIISGGFNVYAIEVEAALVSHPAVLMAPVVGIPHPAWGESVHAEIVLRKGIEIASESIVDHVKQRLGGYKAPKSLLFVDNLPLSPVGKVLRREVCAKYWLRLGRCVN